MIFWIEIGFVALAVLAVWLAALKMRVPVPRVVPPRDHHDFLRDAIARHEADLRTIGFTFVGVFDCAANPKQKTQVAVHHSPQGDVEFAIMGIQHEGIPPMIVLEFCSTLQPHGELVTNTNEHFSSQFTPADHFVVKMPWVHSLPDLYLHHLDHLNVLAAEGFAAQTVRAEDAGERIVDQLAHNYQLQVLRKRMKQNHDGSFQFTLWGAILATPLHAWAMMNPLAKLLVGRRKDRARFAQLRKSARAARLLPPALRMTAART